MLQSQITRRQAPAHIRAAVHSILAGSMAGTLCRDRIDLTDRVAARNCLEVAGYGEASVALLLDRAIAVAALSSGSIKACGGADG